MKKLSLLVLLISITLLSCTKQLDTGSSINATLMSSESTLHDSYNITIPLEYIDYSACAQEEVAVSGEWTLTGRYLVVNGKIRYRGTVQYKHTKGIGLTTGRAYILNVFQREGAVLDILAATDEPKGLFSYNVKGSVSCPSTGDKWSATGTVKYSVDFITGEYTYYKNEFTSDCK
jgi:hypothetical protein